MTLGNASVMPCLEQTREENVRISWIGTEQGKPARVGGSASLVLYTK
jgi:hypothetical protein